MTIFFSILSTLLRITPKTEIRMAINSITSKVYFLVCFKNNFVKSIFVIDSANLITISILILIFNYTFEKISIK